MVARRRIVAFCCLVALALGLRLAWAFSLETPRPLLDSLWVIIECFASTAVVAAVAILAWSAIADRPVVGWLAGFAAAVYPPHVELVSQGRIALWLALLTTLLLLTFYRVRGVSVRALLLVAALAAVVLPPLVEHRLGSDNWLPPAMAGDCAEGDGPIFATECPASTDVNESSRELGQSPESVWQRLRALALYAGEGNCAGDRLCRFASVAWLMMSAMGLAISAPRWRQLWPTYLLLVAAIALVAAYHASAECRAVIEPATFLWTAWCLTPMFTPAARRPAIRVFAPGQSHDDPLQPRPILHRPHFGLPPRRRAG